MRFQPKYPNAELFNLNLNTTMRKKQKNTPSLIPLVLSAVFILGIFSFSPQVFGQERMTITGKVVDNATNEPLPGVVVLIKGTTTGAITDGDGMYSIQAPTGSVLEYSYMGYLTENVTVGINPVIDVLLVQDIVGLQEVIVVGYGVQQKSLVTGSIASVGGDELRAVRVPSATQALQGMAAGVQIIPRSGRPGESSDIRIRGVSSISGTEPLIIVDGVPGSLEGLNPNDIKSIEVLKDASSQAIFGASGGNGVILVTTHSGQKGEIRTSFDFYRGVTSPVGRLDLMDRDQWLELMNETGDLKTTRPDTFPNYDWQDIIFQNAITQDYNLNVSGGSEHSSFMLSSNYNKESGLVKSTNQERINLRLHSTHDLTKWLKIDQKTRFLNTVVDGFESWEWQGYYDNPIREALMMQPITPPYIEGVESNNGRWGSLGTHGNPLTGLDMRNRTRKDNNISTNFSVIIAPFKGLTLTSRIAGNLGFEDTKQFTDKYWAHAMDNRTNNELFQRMGRTQSWTWQEVLNYSTQIGGVHNIDLMAGMEVNRWRWYDINGSRLDIRSSLPNMLYFSMSQNDTLDRQNIEGTGGEGRSAAMFGRVNYNYAGKYMITANFRRDGSSSFGPANRWGLFPSVSVGWKFSDETFMDNIRNIMSFGRLRFGYGEVGANARSGFPYMSTVHFTPMFRYSFDNQVGLQGGAPIKIPNPEIKWESVIMSNVGIDLAFFNNRLTLTTEYFSKVNDGMLMEIEVPSIAGSWQFDNGVPEGGVRASPEVNVGSVRNTGLEITLGAKKMEGRLKGGINLNASFIRNEVLELATDSLRRGGVHFISPLTLTREGDPISMFWGYQTDGLFRETDPFILDNRGRRTYTNQPYRVTEEGEIVYAQTRAVAGDVRYVDANGDGRVGSDEDKVLLGSPHPKAIFGFSFDLSYDLNGWGVLDFNAFFNGQYGNKIFNGMKEYLFYHEGRGNHLAEYANRYRDEVVLNGVVVVSQNHDTDMPRNAAVNYDSPNDFYIEDGSYLRLRSATLGYSLPKSLLERVDITNVRLFVSGTNLFTLTNYSGYNPEVSGNDLLTIGVDMGLYPLSRMWSFGANLTF